jgi:hypothetical protein
VARAIGSGDNALSLMEVLRAIRCRSGFDTLTSPLWKDPIRSDEMAGITGFALRLALTDHVGIPLENEPDPLSEAETAFAPPPPKSCKLKSTGKSKESPTLVKAPPKKSAAKKKKVA